MTEERMILKARHTARESARRRVLEMLTVAGAKGVPAGSGLLASLSVAAGALFPLRSSAADRANAAKRMLIVGDSLSAEYGIGRGEGWVHLLEQRIEPRGWGVANASISGETTAGGLARLPSLLIRDQPAITVIELGANDALRGLPLATTEANLRRMVELAKTATSEPMLIGMMMPPNFGAAYARQFSDLFVRIAESEKIPLVPFLLEGFADDMTWFQSDRIHPTTKAQPRMLDNVWPVISRLL